MRKIAVYILILGAAVAIPIRGTDVGRLHPVELIQIYKVGEQVSIVTDTGASGQGINAGEAIEDLKATTSGIVFLDTAEYLLVDGSAMEEITQMRNYLKRSVRVCESRGQIDTEVASGFLASHKPALRLEDAQNTGSLPVLSIENGKMILKE